MEELCATFVDLDMESKFFETVGYDTDDPDFTWHADVSESAEDDYPSPPSSSSLSNEKADDHNRKRQRKRQISKKRGQNAADVASLPEDGETSKVDSSTSFDRKKIDLSRRDLSFCWNSKLGTSDSDTDSSSKEIIKNHRNLIMSKSLNKDATELKVKCLTNLYPSSEETLKTAPSTYPISTETEPNYPIPVHISTARRREQINPERRKTDCGLHRRFSPPFTEYGSRSTSEGEPCSYLFKSPHKKFKRSPKLNRQSVKSPGIMPCYRNYQLLGDSQLLRFSEQLLNYKTFVTHAEHASSRRLGYCVSGQKIRDLEQRILKNELKLLDKLIILIGTNDMVYGTALKSMCDSFDSMLKKLTRIAERIVVLTVPPVPKLVNDSKHILKLKRFNQFLMNCADNRKVFLVDLASLFISYSNTISEQFFEPVFYKTRKNSKIDLIHLNRSGFKLLRAILDIEYFDKLVPL